MPLGTVSYFLCLSVGCLLQGAVLVRVTDCGLMLLRAQESCRFLLVRSVRLLALLAVFTVSEFSLHSESPPLRETVSLPLVPGVKLTHSRRKEYLGPHLSIQIFEKHNTLPRVHMPAQAVARSACHAHCSAAVSSGRRASSKRSCERRASVVASAAGTTDVSDAEAWLKLPGHRCAFTKKRTLCLQEEVTIRRRPPQGIDMQP